ASPAPHRGCAVRLAAGLVTLDAHRARYRLAARGGGSHPTHEGMRSFPRTARGEDIIADRLGGQNRWPLTERSPTARSRSSFSESSCSVFVVSARRRRSRPRASRLAQPICAALIFATRASPFGVSSSSGEL